MLRLEDVHAYYGESHVLQGVSLEVNEGEVVCLLGRNGAGKTTTLRAIMGLTPPRGGRIEYNGEPIHGLRPHTIARKAIGYVPEDRRIFPGLSVHDNLEIAERTHGDGPRQWTIERIFETFTLLAGLRERPGDTLSGGEQQMLAIARALVGEPSLLLLDEPVEGLAPVIVQQLGAMIDELARTTTVLLAEQNLRFALRHAQRSYVIEKGRIQYEASTEALRADPSVIDRYLSV